MTKRLVTKIIFVWIVVTNLSVCLAQPQIGITGLTLGMSEAQVNTLLKSAGLNPTVSSAQQGDQKWKFLKVTFVDAITQVEIAAEFSFFGLEKLTGVSFSANGKLGAPKQFERWNSILSNAYGNNTISDGNSSKIICHSPNAYIKFLGNPSADSVAIGLGDGDDFPSGICRKASVARDFDPIFYTLQTESPLPSADAKIKGAPTAAARIIPTRAERPAVTKAPLQAGQFEKLDANYKSVRLSELSGEKLLLNFSCEKEGIVESCRVFATFRARDCSADYGKAKIQADGSLEIEKAFDWHSCQNWVHNCPLILEKGWGSWRSQCGAKIFARGRFDGGINVETFGTNIDKNTFYKDPEADAIATAIPAPKWKLGDEGPKYQAIFQSVPESIKESAKLGRDFTAADSEYRNIVDAVLDVNRGMFNWYISGSLRNTSIRREGTALVVKGAITYASTMDREWREGKAEIEFVDGKVNCIKYLSDNCSEDYFAIVNPNADRSLSEADRKCIEYRMESRTEVLSGQCVFWDSQNGTCRSWGSDKLEERTYEVVVNLCDRPLNLVAACVLGRKPLTLAPKSQMGTLGLVVMNCKIEKSFSNSISKNR